MVGTVPLVFCAEGGTLEKPFSIVNDMISSFYYTPQCGLWYFEVIAVISPVEGIVIIGQWTYFVFCSHYSISLDGAQNNRLGAWRCAENATERVGHS